MKPGPLTVLETQRSESSRTPESAEKVAAGTYHSQEDADFRGAYRNRACSGGFREEQTDCSGTEVWVWTFFFSFPFFSFFFKMALMKDL